VLNSVFMSLLIQAAEFFSPAAGVHAQFFMPTRNPHRGGSRRVCTYRAWAVVPFRSGLAGEVAMPGVRATRLWYCTTEREGRQLYRL